MAPLQHLFVLMMENRSFDHLFALSNRPDLPAPDPQWGMTGNAPDRVLGDPGHEFEDIARQIAGSPPMSGFQSLPDWNVTRQGFGASDLPILRTLAKQYFLFDNWYSSLPGPTWPNRFFVHAGSSAGLDNSPSDATTIESETIDSLSFSFPNGTVYDKLAAAGHSWRVYHDDLFPQVLSIQSMIDPFRTNDQRFRWIRTLGAETFRDDLNSHYDVDYTFIEPNYGLLSGGFKDGNCQHPVGSMAAGEAFIKYIYECIRSSPVWPNSLLLITYDEHGGFFDHQSPPAATPPGDGMGNAARAEHPQPFAFDRLGVRVPTIAISPWIAQGGLGSAMFPGLTFDHASIIKTAMKIFPTPGFLGNRVKDANLFDGICSLSTLRTGLEDVPLTLPEPASPTPAAALDAQSPIDASPDAATKGFTRIAMSLDLSLQDQATIPQPVALDHPTFTEATALLPRTGAVPLDEAVRRNMASDRTRQQSLNYIRAVADKVKQARGVLPIE